MAPTEKASYLIGGAVVGVLAVLVSLFVFMAQLDARYVGRAEYKATLERLDGNIASVNANLRDLNNALREQMGQQRQGQRVR